MTTKPIRVVERHRINPETNELEPDYDIYIRGGSYLSGVPYFDLGKWLDRARTYVNATSGTPEPLTRTQTCE